MNKVTKQAIVPYSASQMFALVNDVSAYPEFIPGCTQIEVHSQDDNTMEVSMTVEKLGFNATLRTRNTLVLNEKIAMTLQSGPLKQLQGEWRFFPLGESAAKIEFALQFDLGGGVVKRMMAQYFHGLAETMLQAFESRAKEIYG